MSTHKRILIVSGGTGGHIYPGIALAEELKKRGAEIFFITKEKNKKIIDDYGFPAFAISGEGWGRKLSGRVFSFLAVLIVSFISSAKILIKLKPEIVIGMGGYLSFPALVLARLLGKKTLIYECNFYPGLANRALALIVQRVAVAFAETKKYLAFPQKVVAVGFPIRKEINASYPQAEARRKLGLTENRFTLLVFGGSQGAHFLNQLLLAALPRLLSFKDKIQFIHLTGEKDCPEVEAGYRKTGFMGKVLPYFAQMELAYAAADLVICRAGAATVAELIAVRKPAFLIPFSQATEDHQTLNAQYLAGFGAAEIFPEKELSAEKISREISNLVSSPAKLQQMSLAYEKIAFPTSAAPLSEIVLFLGDALGDGVR
ncbi:MAG: undecaprenyldiphospho-muramoylpentapeptide beta-N-acetylglucosaminyltransferase [Elusimicrobiota bacterium]